jgi:hypothetical protein
MNVLVHEATSPYAQRALLSVTRVLGSRYAVRGISTEEICNGPWQSNAALLVVADDSTLHERQTALPGSAEDRIRSFVNHGGRYLGIGQAGILPLSAGLPSVAFETNGTLSVLSSPAGMSSQQPPEVRLQFESSSAAPLTFPNDWAPRGMDEVRPIPVAWYSDHDNCKSSSAAAVLFDTCKGSALLWSVQYA